MSRVANSFLSSYCIVLSSRVVCAPATRVLPSGSNAVASEAEGSWASSSRRQAPSRRPLPSRHPPLRATSARGGATPSSTRSTRAASRTATATASATSRASARRLPYLADLGVDAIWFTPWYRSPLADGGYDVADYRAIDPAFGTLEEAERLIAEAAAVGIRTIVDIVPNHVSVEHAWFQAAIDSAARLPGAGAVLVPRGPRPAAATRCRPPGRRPSPARRGRGRPTPTAHPASGTCTCSHRTSPTSTGTTPTSAASTRRSSGSGSTGASPASGSTPRPCSSRTRRCPRSRASPVRANTPTPTATSCTRSTAAGGRSPTAIPGTRVLVGELWIEDVERFAQVPPAGRAPHGVQLRLPGPAVGRREPARVHRRHARRPRPRRRAGHLADLQPRRDAAGDPVTGRRTPRSRSPASGAAPRPISTSGDVGHARRHSSAPRCPARSTSTRARSWASRRSRTCRSSSCRTRCTSAREGVDPGRDGCRVPLPWSGDRAPFGFSPDGARHEPWLRQPEGWAALTVEAQLADPESMLNLYRSALRIRRLDAQLGDGSLHVAPVRGRGARVRTRRPGSCASPTSRRPPSSCRSRARCSSPAHDSTTGDCRPMRRPGSARTRQPGRRPARRQGKRHEEELMTTACRVRRQPGDIPPGRQRRSAQGPSRRSHKA